MNPWLVVAFLMTVNVCLLLFALSIYGHLVQAREEANDEAVLHMDCHENMAERMAMMYRTEAQATALRNAADKWDDPTLNVSRNRFVSEHYVDGGPSVPALWLRAEADKIEECMK